MKEILLPCFGKPEPRKEGLQEMGIPRGQYGDNRERGSRGHTRVYEYHPNTVLKKKTNQRHKSKS